MVVRAGRRPARGDGGVRVPPAPAPDALHQEHRLCLERAGLDDQGELDGGRHAADPTPLRSAPVPPPLLIAGMHRSGTSATARLLHQAGLDLGHVFIDATLDNPLGYYEDRAFCDLNLRLLRAGLEDPALEPDWAFPDRIDPGRLGSLVPRARALLEERAAADRTWGFKDPRTTVLLGFYDALVPDARHLFVYRAPWDVLRSLMETRLRPLHGRAGVALRAWMAYNERVLAFRAARPGRTALVHVDAIARRPGEVLALVQVQLDALAAGTVLDGAAAARAFVGRWLRQAPATSALAELLGADHPEALELYARLEAEADLPSRTASPARRAIPVDVEDRDGPLPLTAVLAGAQADALEEIERIARPALDSASAAEAADAGASCVPGDLLLVLFAGQLHRGALDAALAQVVREPHLAAVLLGPGDEPIVVDGSDLLARAERGAGILVRRERWLACGGFAALGAPDGFEAWALAAACIAAGAPVGRIAGAIRLPGAGGDDPAARRAVLATHPSLAAERAIADGARAAAAESELARLRSTRAWRLVTRWWRARARLRRAAR